MPYTMFIGGLVGFLIALLLVAIIEDWGGPDEKF